MSNETVPLIELGKVLAALCNSSRRTIRRKTALMDQIKQHKALQEEMGGPKSREYYETIACLEFEHAGLAQAHNILFEELKDAGLHKLVESMLMYPSEDDAGKGT